MGKKYWVYIVTNRNRTTLYTGVTGDLRKRIFEHKCKRYKGFTSKYNLDELVYYEEFDEVNDAISREKQIKGGSRAKKVALIEAFNPGWCEIEV